MSAHPSGVVTFLFTDIEGSTKLSQQYPDEIPELLARHNQIIGDAVEPHNGFVFQIVGDSFAVAFHSISDAVHAALDAQRALYGEVWSPAPIKVRMGIHVGTAQLKEDGNYLGYTTLATTQRIMSAGHGGQILISQAVHDQLLDEGSVKTQVVDLGEHHLKDVIQKQHLYQLNLDGLPVEFPPLKTQKVINHNLPIKLTSFIGRGRELQEIKTRLESARLLSLIGPGGTGKTRLSIQLGGELLHQFPDGVWMIELAPISDPAFIPQSIASVFGLRESPERPLTELVIDFLRAKNLLLILDNCEHLIESCAVLAESLLQACLNLKILASSREALGVSGEMTYRVPSLFLPVQAMVTREAVLECESVQLFADRATVSNPNFEITDENASTVAQICRRLDGIPLALELAAARAKVLSVQQIAERLDDRFRLLTGGSRTALPRQQTLRALIDWSYDLLDTSEKVLFRRLAVFVGGWTLEAAEKVCSDNSLDEYEVLDLLTQLVDKSLVIAEEKDGAVRYHRLETIRQYAREKLLETDETAKLRNRHLDYYIQLSEWANQNWLSPKQKEVEKIIKTEQANYRAALAWAFENSPEKTLQLMSWIVSVILYLFQGNISEAKNWIDSTMDKLEALPPAEGDAIRTRKHLLAAGYDFMAGIDMNQGDHQASRAAARKSVEIAREINDQRLLAQALASLGIGELYSGNPENALAVTKESLGICKQLDLKLEYMWALNTMRHIHTVNGNNEQLQEVQAESRRLELEAGVPSNPAAIERDLSTELFMQGNMEAAVEHAEKAFKLFEEQNDKYDLTFFISDVAHTLRQSGNLEKALSYYKRSIVRWQDFGHRAAVAHQLECFALIALAQEKYERAALLFGHAENLRKISNSLRTPAEQMEFEGAKSRLSSHMGEAEFTEAWERGRNLTMEQAIEKALEEVGEPNGYHP